MSWFDQNRPQFRDPRSFQGPMRSLSDMGQQPSYTANGPATVPPGFNPGVVPPTTPTTPATPPAQTPAPGTLPHKPQQTITNPLSKDSTREQVKMWIADYFAARGVTPRPTTVDYYADKFFGDFNADFGYLQSKLSEAEEFGGGGNMGGGNPLDSPLLKGYGKEFSYDPNKILESPAFEAAMKRGIGALENSAAAKGTVLSSGIMKDIADWTTGLGLSAINDDFGRSLDTASFNRGTYWGDTDRQFQRLADFTRLGQSGAGQLGGYSAQYGAGVGDVADRQSDNTTNQGNANAGGILAGGSPTDWRPLLRSGRGQYRPR